MNVEIGCAIPLFRISVLVLCRVEISKGHLNDLSCPLSRKRLYMYVHTFQVSTPPPPPTPSDPLYKTMTHLAPPPMTHRTTEKHAGEPRPSDPTRHYCVKTCRIGPPPLPPGCQLWTRFFGRFLSQTRSGSQFQSLMLYLPWGI